MSDLSKSTKKPIFLLVAAVLVVAVALFLLIGMDSGSDNEVPSEQVQTEDSGPIQEAGKEIAGAYASLDSGDVEEALAYVQRALEIEPNDIDIRYNAAEIFMLADMPEEARNQYVQALVIYQNTRNPDADGQEPGIYLTAGDLAVQAEAIDQAREYYQRAINATDAGKEEHKGIINQATTALETL